MPIDSRPNGMKHGFVIAAAVILALSSFTYLTMEGTWRFREVAGLELPRLAASDDLDAWTRSHAGLSIMQEAGPPVFCLDSAAPQSIPFLTAVTLVPPGPDFLGFSVETRAEGMAGGARPWQQGRIMAWSFDRDHRHLRFWPSEVAAVTGTQDWTAQSLIIPMDGRVKAVRAIAYNASPTGKLCLRDLQLIGLQERPAFTVLRFALWPAWIGALLWIAYGTARAPGRRALKAMIYLVATATLIMILLPQPYYARLVGPAGGALGAWLAPPEFVPPGQGEGQSRPGAPDAQVPAQSEGESQVRGPTLGPGQVSQGAGPSSGPLQDLADWLSLEEVLHATAFGLLAVLACLAFHRASFVVLGSSLCLAVVGSEAMQLMLITRSSEAADLIADLAGVGLGLTAAALLRLGLGLRRAPPGPRPPPL